MDERGEPNQQSDRGSSTASGWAMPWWEHLRRLCLLTAAVAVVVVVVVVVRRRRLRRIFILLVPSRVRGVEQPEKNTKRMENSSTNQTTQKLVRPAGWYNVVGMLRVRADHARSWCAGNVRSTTTRGAISNRF